MYLSLDLPAESESAETATAATVGTEQNCRVVIQREHDTRDRSDCLKYM